MTLDAFRARAIEMRARWQDARKHCERWRAERCLTMYRHDRERYMRAKRGAYYRAANAAR